MSAKVKLPVALHMGETLPVDPDGVRAAIEGYAETLLDSLEIPAEVTVELVSGPLEDLPSGDASFITGREASGLTRHDEDGRLTAESAAQLGAMAVCDGRCQLVTAAVVDAVWKGWTGGESGDAPAGLAEALRDAVRYGVSLEKVRAAWEGSADPDNVDTFRVAVDRALDARGKPLARLAMGRELYARCFDPATDEPLQPEGEDDPLDVIQSNMVDGLFYSLGMIVEVEIEPDGGLEPFGFSTSFYDLPGPPMSNLAEGEFLVNEIPSRLNMLHIEARAVVNPANGSENAVVSSARDAEACREVGGYTTWGQASYAVLCASAHVRRNAAAFIDGRFARLYLARLGSAFPTLVRAIDERFDRGLITGVLRGLIEEEISIRDARGIMEGLLAVQGVSSVDHGRYIVFDPFTERRCPVPAGRTLEDLRAPEYAEAARGALRDFISHKHTQGASSLLCFLVDPAIEAELQQPEPLTPSRRREIIRAVYEEAGGRPGWSSQPVILTTVSARKRMRRLVEAEFPELPVLSYQELRPDMNIQPIARISVD